jgi:hypothetical protein
MSERLELELTLDGAPVRVDLELTDDGDVTSSDAGPTSPLAQLLGDDAQYADYLLAAVRDVAAGTKEPLQLSTDRTQLRIAPVTSQIRYATPAEPNPWLDVQTAELATALEQVAAFVPDDAD